MKRKSMKERIIQRGRLDGGVITWLCAPEVLRHICVDLVVAETHSIMWGLIRPPLAGSKPRS